MVVFMALAWFRDLGQHIGKIPGAPLIPATGISRGIRDWSWVKGWRGAAHTR
jgi:hypothetical protein